MWLDGGVGHGHCALLLLLWGRRRGWWLLWVVWWGGHHDGAGVGALLLLRGDRGERGVRGGGVVDECYAEHLGLAPWGWWGLLLHGLLCLLREAGAAEGLVGWRCGGGLEIGFFGGELDGVGEEEELCGVGGWGALDARGGLGWRGCVLLLGRLGALDFLDELLLDDL